jgi:hypothetical protein
MGFLTVGKEPEGPQLRLYLMEITLPTGMVVMKYGKSSGISSKRRMMEICESIYDKSTERRTPSIKIIRDQKCDNPFELELIFRDFFINYRYATKATWVGSTECYVIPMLDAKTTFDLVLGGATPDTTYKMPGILTMEDISNTLTF